MKYQDITPESTRGLDSGLATMCADNQGQLMGRNWLKKLIQYDRQINSLLASRNEIKARTENRQKNKSQFLATYQKVKKQKVNNTENKLLDINNHNQKQEVSNHLRDKMVELNSDKEVNNVDNIVNDNVNNNDNTNTNTTPT